MSLRLPRMAVAVGLIAIGWALLLSCGEPRRRVLPLRIATPPLPEGKTTAVPSDRCRYDNRRRHYRCDRRCAAIALPRTVRQPRRRYDTTTVATLTLAPRRTILPTRPGRRHADRILGQPATGIRSARQHPFDVPQQ